MMCTSMLRCEPFGQFRTGALPVLNFATYPFFPALFDDRHPDMSVFLIKKILGKNLSVAEDGGTFKHGAKLPQIAAPTAGSQRHLGVIGQRHMPSRQADFLQESLGKFGNVFPTFIERRHSERTGTELIIQLLAKPP